MYIKNRDIEIRNAVPADAALLCTWWNDGTVMEHAGFPLGLGIDEKQVTEKINAETDDTTRRHIIQCKGIPVGEMNYRRTNADTCEIGIKICEKEYQNRGLGRVVLSMFIDGLFHRCGYKKVLLDTNLNNLRAQRVYEKLGFRKLRINIDSWTAQLGRKQSYVDYELTEKDFVSFINQEILYTNDGEKTIMKL